jgi:hypothetical protein
MNPLETELRATLRERAADVPPAAVSRLRHADYRPRTHRLQPRIAVGGGVLTAGAATAAILSLTSGASTAFAGWSAQPTKPSAAQLATVEQACQQQIPIKGLPLALSDTRGPFTFRIYANATQMADCTVGPSFTHSSGFSSDGPLAPPAGRVKLGGAQVTLPNGNSYSFAQGSVGDGVTGVTLNLSDGTTVTATVQNGWYVAWWPGSAELSSADVQTASGTHSQAFQPKVCTGDCGGTDTTGAPGTHPPSVISITGFDGGGQPGARHSGSFTSSP